MLVASPFDPDPFDPDLFDPRGIRDHTRLP